MQNKEVRLTHQQLHELVCECDSNQANMLIAVLSLRGPCKGRKSSPPQAPRKHDFLPAIWATSIT